MIYTFASKDEFNKLGHLANLSDPGTIVVITGSGFSNVIKSLSKLNKNDNVTNIGYCGSNKIPVGTQVKIRDCYAYHPYGDAYSEDSKYACNSFSGEVDCYTAGDFVVETKIEEPVVFDMELYAICSMGFSTVQSIKIVSDTLDVDQYTDKLK